MPKEARRVLIVEDDRANRALLTELLVADGYETRAVGRGADALALLRWWRPDLILLDLSIADMTGAAFRAVQLATPSAADVPLAVVSASGRLRDESASLGAAAAVPKPFDIDELVATVRRVCGGPCAETPAPRHGPVRLACGPESGDQPADP
jgi:CheY-like chemotaxis protein